MSEIQVFWDVELCRLVNSSQRFAEAWFLFVQGLCRLHTDYTDSDDGGSCLLHVSYPRKLKSSSYLLPEPQISLFCCCVHALSGPIFSFKQHSTAYALLHSCTVASRFGDYTLIDVLCIWTQCVQKYTILPECVLIKFDIGCPHWTLGDKIWLSHGGDIKDCDLLRRATVQFDRCVLRFHINLMM